MFSQAFFRRLVLKSVHYGLIGLVGLGINFAVFHLALLGGLSPIASNFLAIAISIMSNFVIATHTRLLAQQAGLSGHVFKLGHWVACSVAGIAANTGVFVATVIILGNTDANVLAAVVGMGVSYLLAITTRLFPV